MVPALQSLHLTIFQLYDGAKVIHMQWELYFKSWMLIFSWASHMWHNPLSRCPVVRAAQLPVSQAIMRVREPTHFQPFCTQSFCFSLLEQNSINEIFNTLL